MKYTREAIEYAQADLEDLIRKYLLERGWSYTSQTPGSYWMWNKKDKDGRDLLVTQDMALSMQERLDDSEQEKPPSPGVDEMPTAEEMQSHLQVDETGVKAEAEFRGTAIKAWIIMAVDWFRQVGGKSYVVMRFTDSRDGEAYTFTVQRRGGDTPPLSDEPLLIVRRTFDLAKRLRHFYSWDDALLWIELPQKTLGDRRAVDLIATKQGADEVSAVLAQLEDSAHI